MGSPIYKSSPIKFAFYEIASGSFGHIQIHNEINRSTIRDSITKSIWLPDRRKYNFFSHIGRYILIAGITCSTTRDVCSDNHKIGNNCV